MLLLFVVSVVGWMWFAKGRFVAFCAQKSMEFCAGLPCIDVQASQGTTNSIHVICSGDYARYRRFQNAERRDCEAHGAALSRTSDSVCTHSARASCARLVDKANDTVCAIGAIPIEQSEQKTVPVA